MKILIANKYLYPRGGDCIYTMRLMELLKEKGHTVIPFSMKHPENMKTDYDDYFVPYIDFREQLKRFSVNSAVKVASRAIINSTAVKLMEKLIEDTKPDVVHLVNIHHQLTPAIIRVPNSFNIPVVWRMCDYTLFCPDHLFLRNGKVCNKCADGAFYNAIKYKCKKNSFGASLIAALECSLYPPRKLAKMVDKFICPSMFMANVLSQYGIPEERIEHIATFFNSADCKSYGDEYFLYVGRLSHEKGVDVLIDAFAQLKGGRLIIVGDGPQKDDLKTKVKNRGIDNIDFAGYKSRREVDKLMGGALAVIVPSTCWENFPNSALEAMMASKPVIGSSTGGIPEIIDHEKTGYLFETGDAFQLAGYMSKLLNNKGLASNMGKAGRDKVTTEYTAEIHYNKLMKVYESLSDKNLKRGKSRLVSIETIQ